MVKTGKVYLVGAGPGDPLLITIKAVAALALADCVIYDFLANERLLEHAKKGAERIYAGKKGRAKTMAQEEINALIIRKAKAGKTVVRLKGGDPFIFGRGGEEAEELVKAGLTFEVIPGVSSAIAAPAYAGIPLTHRDFASSVTFITGQEDPRKESSNIAWDALSKGTLVFLMGWKNLPTIAAKLHENGWDDSTPVALIRWGTMTKQRCVTGRLDNIARLAVESGMKPPMITVVGNVVKLRDKLNWFETKPLFGKRVLITRTSAQAGAFARLLEAEGAEPIGFPVIKTIPPASWAALDRAIKRLSSYDWAIFTSVNGVNYFFERLYKLGKDVRALYGVKLCAIGPKTAEALKGRGLNVDLTPSEYRAEAIIEALGRRRIRGKRFLLARALDAREVLPTEIKRLGGMIDVPCAYRTILPVKEAGALKEELSAGNIDVVTFTSSSTVTNFMSIFKKGEAQRRLGNVKIACIGPITAKTAEDAMLKVDIMPGDYTVEALCCAMTDYYGKGEA
ncbi:MAG: uroporphyrinogen-III C-methyltransferase [Deltaproteobacteria bacterium]